MKCNTYKFLHLEPNLLHQYRKGKQDYAFSKHLLNSKYMLSTVLDTRHTAGNQGDEFSAFMGFTDY